MSVYGALTPDTPRYQDEARDYDAILVMSFGGPEGMDDVMPFLENVTRGRNIPRERLEEVAQHYYHFGGVSPINQQNRALIAALKTELAAHQIHLPIYFGNRNWHPMIDNTLRQMRDDGVQRAIAFFTSTFSSYSGCRQYREDIIRASEKIENAPEVDKIRVFYNHPGFIEACVDNLQASLNQFDEPVHVVFTAHSIPLAMAQKSAYEAQLKDACHIIAQTANITDYALVYQSRSGAPHIPWLEPDILDHIETLHQQGIRNLVIMPLGFISDHMEVLFDLDTEAAQKAQELGMHMIRAATPGTHPRFIAMIRELIVERMTQNPVRPALGRRGAGHDICPINCCLPR
ncbi:MAG: ferrochelatase [Phototrophicales bacterium]|nr:MAG: ferrochelatase [Phototrophicales bacterium]RMG73667.1 MAG: ferrochelatase [Chloroflexota bacterium]